jgi:hypothetical protein
MATITPSTFHPLLAHVNVRLQQGVPIVDADWNLLDDIRKFELRAFLKWFVGDGVPHGNDGFRITGSGDNSFTILAGGQGPSGTLSEEAAALRQVGRYLVDGLDVLIEHDLDFDAQPLHTSQSGSTALAAALGVPVVDALATPTADEQVVVELDVWERLLTPDDDPDLVHAGLGVETCARVRREWVVRAYEQGSVAPRLAGHSYARLATLSRFAGEAAIRDPHISDDRERRLLLPPSHLVQDVLGVDPFDYRRGGGRPVISLRDAVNALLAGQLPTSPEIAVSPGPGTDQMRRSAVLDNLGGLAVVWQSPRVGSVLQVFLSSLDLSQPEAGFSDAVAITVGPTPHSEASVVALPTGELVVVYQAGVLGGTATDVVMKRGLPGDLATAAEEVVSATAGVADQTPYAVLCGDHVVLFFQKADTSTWFFRRYRVSDGTFRDATPRQLSSLASGLTGGLHVAAAGNRVWTAFVANTGGGMKVEVHRLDPEPDPPVIETLSTGSLAGTLPFVLPVSPTEAMVFFDDVSVKFVTITGTTVSAATTIADSAEEAQAAATRDPDGTVQLLSTRSTAASSNEVFLRRRDPATNVWGSPQPVVSHLKNDMQPHPVLVPSQGTWLLWISDRPGTGNFDLYAKRIITRI